MKYASIALQTFMALAATVALTTAQANTSKMAKMGNMGKMGKMGKMGNACGSMGHATKKNSGMKNACGS